MEAQFGDPEQFTALRVAASTRDMDCWRAAGLAAELANNDNIRDALTGAPGATETDLKALVLAPLASKTSTTHINIP